MGYPTNIMVLGWNWRRHLCTHCQKWGKLLVHIMDLDNSDELSLCHDCYEGLLGVAELHGCASGACDT